MPDCATPANNDCTLRDALAVATSGGDTVMFGTRFPRGTRRINIGAHGSLAISHTVTLAGPVAQTVAIDGSYNTRTHTGGVRIFDVSGAATFTLHSLTIQHGNPSGASVKPGLGGVRMTSDSTLAVTLCTFTVVAVLAGLVIVYCGIKEGSRRGTGRSEEYRGIAAVLVA